MKEKTEKKEQCFRTTIGGQALIEGILMRGPEKQAIVVRLADGTLQEKTEELKYIKDRYPILGWPLIRGVVIFFSSLINGVKALMYSADCLPEEEQAAQEDAVDRWINAHFEGERAKKLIIGVSVVLGILLAVAIFMVLPYLITGLFTNSIGSSFVKNVIDGVLRIIIFLVYIRLVTLSKDIHRVFEYHGAEHKSIHCYEKGLPLTVENIRPQPREHPRCGTSFLFVVMIVSFLVFSVVSWKNRLVAFFLRLLLLPVVVAFSYEINRWAGRHDNLLSRILSAPGRALQKLTVFEPDESMMEVAARALTLVIPEEKGADRW
ncbi:MAG: DUF1385 domain-containing protein [Oscillospiraceae bacterium]|jgi:uncharacterized protein YqhQ|nr:DUF1385 domain-containing protein [Oscillospiraceae bacterium]